MSRGEGPSEEKLSALRDAGVLPYSRLATVASGAAITLLTLILIPERMLAFFKKVNECAAPVLVSCVSSEGKTLLPLFLIPVVGALATVFLVGLLQTKFFLKIGMIGSSQKRKESIARERPVIIGIVPVIFLLILVPWFLAKTVLRSWFTLLVEPLHELVGHVASFSEVLVAIVAFILFSVAVLSWVVARLLYMYNHRMTYEEQRGSTRG